ncbi:TPR-like protein [Rhodocollybia butyracea]|uniref:TPR-like protein n=1 Tax=Rhodocollybia butyracea TaxID=206335 RepID=A0A9P5PXH8_9AGAR|nr:TPR-like protein [Rhodocollybia butyracea]
MSSIVKTKLKNARDCLGKKNFAGAKDAALQALQFEADNYNANVFLGLASLELGELTESEQAYKRAAELNPEQILAWQGLSQFYERTEDWEKYADILRCLVDIHTKSEDAVKCAETLQKYIDLQRKHDTSSQLIDALYLLLPDSSPYQVLSNLPAPDPTNPTSTTTFHVQVAVYNSLIVIEELVAIIEREEETFIRKEFEKRRTRLNAGPPDQIRKQIGCEVWGNSRLPSLYTLVLNHPNTTDELRRETDAKLLRYNYTYMVALPSTEQTATTKMQIMKEIENLISGTVLLHIPDELAWTLFLEKKDVETIGDYDYALLQEFMELFPSHSLTALLTGYFIYMHIPMSDEDQDSVVEDSEVGYDMILEAYPSLSTSLIASHIVGEIYLLEADYENAIQAADKGLQILATFELENGIKLTNVRLAFQVILASSLVHFYPPKHHPRAMQIINEILEVSPESVAALMGKGHVQEASENWEEAKEHFGKVIQLVGGDVGLRAKEEHAWCISRIGDLQTGINLLKAVIERLDELENHDHDRARCYWRLGKCLWNLGSEKIVEGYQIFITALKCDPNYAPAFTCLGIYYAEHASPPDPTRASKCFQKAFELDSKEADAAHRLAKGFADEQEWDLVEVIARRTIEGEGGLDGGLLSTTDSLVEKYRPTNAWAWKALGIVHLMNRKYMPAINVLQVALRAEPEDSLTWMRLGEAYFKSGRHIAALKALGRAQELHSGEDDWICSYFIAEVYRQTGKYEEAVHQLETILALKTSELSVLAGLAQTCLDLGCFELANGYTARAEQSFVQSIRLCLRAISDGTGFRTMIWKTAADALYHLSTRDVFCDEDSVHAVLVDVENALGEPSARITKIVSLPSQRDSTTDTISILELSIAIYDHRIGLGSSENVTIGSAWFDLSVALRALAQKLSAGSRKTEVLALISAALIKSIHAAPTNDAYWVALGDTNFVEQPKIAQHAYIKALDIDSKNAGTWANLGLLFLYHGDFELANEAFYRSQSADPDYTVAWIGQALIAMNSSHTSGATGILEHAVGLADIQPEADYQYSSLMFTRMKENSTRRTSSSTVDSLLPAFFVLDRYLRSRPNDPTALHLYALICESVGQAELGVDLIAHAISLLESLYEQTEDIEIERQFTIAHSNIGRMKLSLNDYGGALESFESSLGLLSEENDSTTVLLRVQGQFGSGIAHFKMGNLESALEFFEAALESAADNTLVRGEVIVMLSQTLWAIGTPDSKEQGKTLLLECISMDPENLIAINTLAAMGILTEDETLLDAALSEILSLPVDRKLELDPQRNVDRLLIQNYLGQDEPEKALGVAQRAVFSDPARHETRDQLATLLFQIQRRDLVLPVLSGPCSENLQEGGTSLKLRTVAEALKGDNTMARRLAQKNILMSPSNTTNWRISALASASRSTS